MIWAVSGPGLAAAIVVVATVTGGYLAARSSVAYLRRRGATPAFVRGARVAISLVSAAIGLGAVVALTGPINLFPGLAVSAILGLAGTLALQTTLQNIIAGFVLLRNRVLRLNDQIQIGGIEGKVVQMGLLTTWLRLADGSLASVSNSTLLSGPFVNRSVGTRLSGEY